MAASTEVRSESVGCCDKSAVMSALPSCPVLSMMTRWHPGQACARSHGGQRVDRSAIIKTLVRPPLEDKAMAQGEEADGTPMAPDPVEGDETDPDKDAQRDADG